VEISGATTATTIRYGESVIYPTLVRMAQTGNAVPPHRQARQLRFIAAALPPSVHGPLSPLLTMLEDLKLDTVDFVPTYDERHTERPCCRRKFQILVNGGSGSPSHGDPIPPHNLGEV